MGAFPDPEKKNIYLAWTAHLFTLFKQKEKVSTGLHWPTLESMHSS